MDEKDLEILRILEENGRISSEEIATMTTLPADDVAARIRAGNIRRLSTGRRQATARSPRSSS
jgi:phage head maturation protease